MDQIFRSDLFVRGFLIKEVDNHPINAKLKFAAGNYLLHGHCHQKAIFTTKSVHSLFSNNADVSFSEIDSGCCGMAGSFGYEKKHYEISETIARSALVPAIEKAPGDTQLIASGFSCRHQIEHFTGKKAKHWVEFINKV
ncbi:MAG: hypothetical protein IPL42_15205 [Saprospiraceae bacterium]|nr:hypothetical protein [Saprospiraceae bacterium]